MQPSMPDKTKTLKREFVLNDRPGITLYVQFANFLRQKIANGHWPPGHRLPTVQALAEELGVARITVRQAYAILVSEGLISSERGRGTRVRENSGPAAGAVRAAINSWLDVPDGFQIRILTREPSATLPEEARLTGAPTGRYMHLRKSHLHNGKILFVSDMYVAAEVFKRLPPRSEEKFKLSGILCRYAPELMKVLHQVITVTQADGELALLLGCRFGVPVAQVRRCVTNDAGGIIYAASTKYLGEYFVFDMTLPVDVVYRPATMAPSPVMPPKKRVRGK